jgi:hypothetical protein
LAKIAEKWEAKTPPNPKYADALDVLKDFNCDLTYLLNDFIWKRNQKAFMKEHSESLRRRDQKAMEKTNQMPFGTSYVNKRSDPNNWQLPESQKLTTAHIDGV